MAWYDDVFKGRYDAFTFHLFTDDRNENDASFLRSALSLSPGQQVLDVACGHGRHALPLAEWGIRVTGIDTTERYLNMARRQAGELPARFDRVDMRSLDYDAQFDAAYCYFSSFGFFDDQTNFEVLKRIRRALKPGGRLLIDLQNRELYSTGEPHYEEFNEFVRDGRQYALLLTSELNVQTSRVEITQRLYGGGQQPREMRFSMRLYTMAELRWLFHLAGLEVENTYGDADSSPYDMTSSRCIIVGRKRKTQ